MNTTAWQSHPGWRPEKIADILLKAGQQAVAYRAGASWELKDDGSLVTAIDVRNEALLKDLLTACLPGSRFIGEETIQSCGEAYLEAVFEGDCWIVDPIDGTSSFAHGFPTWGISVGLMHHGVLTDGAIALPALGEMLMTRGADVLYATRVDYENALGVSPQIAVRSHIDEPFTNGGLFALGQNFTKHGDLPLPNPVVSTGSAVQALSYLVLGHAMAYIGHMKLWDIAGMLPMMSRLGIEVWTWKGGTVECDVRNGAFALSADDSHRWALRDSIYVGSRRVLQTLKEKLG